jgi:hypothetical protein
MVIMRDETSGFLSSGRELEDAFFLAKDKMLMEQQAILKKMKETKDSLREASGIENDAVLQKLVDLNIPPQIVASLALIPLIEVAWADGAIQKKEKEIILKAAHCNSKVDQALLTQWLVNKPEPQLLEAWTHYVRGLCESLTPVEKKLFRETLLAHAYDVAGAEGGILGLGSKISKKERDVLDILGKAF